MASVFLPFYLKSKPSSAGKHRFGWVDVELDVPEPSADASFELAIHSTEPSGQHNHVLRRSFYAYDGELWLAQSGELGPGAFSDINLYGIGAELNVNEMSAYQRKSLTLDFCVSIHGINGSKVAPHFSSKGSFKSIDVIDDGDLKSVRSWAVNNLLVVGNVLLRKVSQPSLVLRVSESNWEPISVMLQPAEIQYGLHFSHADEEFITLLAQCESLFGDGSKNTSNETLVNDLSDRIGRLGRADEFTIAGLNAFNKNAIASLCGEARVRSQALVGLSLLLVNPGIRWLDSVNGKGSRKRAMSQAISSLKQGVFGVEECAEVLSVHLRSIPTDVFPPCFRWVFDRAMERYDDRPIAAPKQSSAFIL
jgi:hypothetical protein